MIRFIELSGTYEYKWEFKYKKYDSDWVWTKYHVCSLKGDKLVEWLQKYGLEPHEMFKDNNLVGALACDNDTTLVDSYLLYKKADEWAKNNPETISNTPWTCVGMNGGYILMSNGSKENTVELGSASNVNIVNTNNNNNDNSNHNSNYSTAYARSSLIG